MDLATLNQQIEELESQQRSIRLKLEPLYQERAEANTPFSIGDVLVDRTGRRARVVRISEGWSQGSPNILGLRLRKDGKEGRKMVLYSWDKWQKEQPDG